MNKVIYVKDEDVKLWELLEKEAKEEEEISVSRKINKILRWYYGNNSTKKTNK